MPSRVLVFAPATLLVLFAPLVQVAPLRAAPKLGARDAVRLALEQSPELTALSYQLDEDKALAGGASRLRNPQLRISDLRSQQIINPLVGAHPDHSYPYFESFEVGLRWQPPDPGDFGARRATAERRVDQTAAALRQEQRDLVAEVRRQHAALLSVDQELALADTAVELRQKLRALIARRLEAQAATALDQSLSELDYLDAVSDREQLVSERRERYHALLMLLGQPAEAELEFAEDGSAPCAMPGGALAAMVARAEVDNPRLQVLAAQRAEVDEELNRAWLELVPWFDFVELSYMLGDEPYRLVEDNTFRLSMGIRLPLLDWNQHEVAGLEARRARRDAELDAARQRIALRVRRAQDELKGRVALYQRFREADQGLVDASLAKIERALEVGEADLMQMALVQRRTLQARRARLRAHLRCQESYIDLERMIGELDAPAEPARAPTSAPAPAPLEESE